MCIIFHLYEMSRIGKYIEAESRSVAPQGQEERGGWGPQLKVTAFLLGAMKFSKIDCHDG